LGKREEKNPGGVARIRHLRGGWGVRVYPVSKGAVGKNDSERGGGKEFRLTEVPVLLGNSWERTIHKGVKNREEKRKLGSCN